MLSKLVNRIRGNWLRRRFFLARWVNGKVPVHNISWLPDSFIVRRLAGTGVSMVENFCSAEEAEEVINTARGRLKKSGVILEGKFQETPGRISDTARLFSADYRHETLYPLMQRASMLVGLPYTHLEDVYVTRYKEGGLYNEHLDFGEGFSTDRLYTVLLYLNTLPESQGGSTVFPHLNAAVQPRVGRAVTWTNKNPDGSGHFEASHAAFPVRDGGEKWVIQFWFRRYPMQKPIPDIELLQARPGIPLEEQDTLPDGVRYTDEGG